METAAESKLVHINKDLIGIMGGHFSMGVIRRNCEWVFDNLQPVTWTNWRSGQPNEDADCLYLDDRYTNEYGFEWWDNPCSGIKYLLCEA